MTRKMADPPVNLLEEIKRRYLDTAAKNLIHLGCPKPRVEKARAKCDELHDDKPLMDLFYEHSSKRIGL